jgi:hypothetical protein
MTTMATSSSSARARAVCAFLSIGL